MENEIKDVIKKNLLVGKKKILLIEKN